MAHWGLNVVKQYERVVVFTFGNYGGLRGPGMRWLWPFINNGSLTADLREVPMPIPRQTNITRDNAPIDIDFFVYMRVLEERAEDTVLRVSNFTAAAQALSMTSLRAVIGEMDLDDVLSKREVINAKLQAKLDEVTVNWGVKVTRVEIKEVEPPREVQDAMNRQLSAERTRRAAVTEAEGERDAAINRAEGERQAAILKAEGSKQSQVLEAEGERQATILRAEGYADALRRINETANSLDSRTMSLQYLETMKDIGSSPSTKFIFPLEFTSMLQPLIRMAADRQPDAGDEL
ncbi:MAG: SPFH/Band 7/PHB domain protein [Dehalococcoidia bacterium]|nr:SPFH/Band 7/PHB domain protein [Dehalococcoidia bacterium]